MFWECDSTIAYFDATMSKLYYCKGDHIVVTSDQKVQQVSLRADCKSTFQTLPDGGRRTMLDVTKDQLPLFEKHSLRPDAVAWVANAQSPEIAYCSKFLAGVAGTQNRCVKATLN
jgi:hypothetical protein